MGRKPNKKNNMKQYRVVMEIQIQAETPVEAAKTFEKWVKEGSRFIYYVQEDDEEVKEIVSVDLLEDDENAVSPVKDYEPLIQN